MIKISAGKSHPAVQSHYNVKRQASARFLFAMSRRSVKRAIQCLQGKRHSSRVAHWHNAHNFSDSVFEARTIKIEPPDQGYVPTHIHGKELSYQDQFHQECSTQSTLQMYMPGRTEENFHECQVCQKLFSCKSTLKRHLYIHTGETPFECEHCEKKFNRSSTLKTHLLIHTGDKPYECEHCEKKFNQNSNLKTHLRIHTGDKPYECEHCEKKFNRSSNLKRHLRIHTGETPYECEHCEKKFNQSS
ncbi:C2H2-type zinc finger protein, partial [Endozoicomonas sp.]|uniref:C2H2-type zinc finger protein n=1 Tax=Endozoicomonas sp. TaxID=1892382 RepID=UPI00383BCE7A